MLKRQQKHRSLAESLGSSSLTSPPPTSSSAAAPGNSGNVDRVLFKNLLEMAPLVESLMDRRATSSFTRRASVVYTPAPSNPTKVVDTRGRRTAQTVSAKEQRDRGFNVSDKHKGNQDGVSDFSIFSSGELIAENVQKDTEELTMLRDQLDSLQKKLLEKDETLKSAENSMNQMSAVYGTLDELRRQVAQKDSLIKSSNAQLSNAEVKLADKQAALEKLEWEARASNSKVEELQGYLDSMDFEITAFMRLYEVLSKSDLAAHPDNITSFHNFDQLSHIDTIDETMMEKMEEARLAYITAVVAATENPSEETLSTAADARLRLQGFVL